MLDLLLGDYVAFCKKLREANPKAPYTWAVKGLPHHSFGVYVCVFRKAASRSPRMSVRWQHAVQRLTSSTQYPGPPNSTKQYFSMSIFGALGIADPRQLTHERDELRATGASLSLELQQAALSQCPSAPISPSFVSMPQAPQFQRS